MNLSEAELCVLWEKLVYKEHLSSDEYSYLRHLVEEVLKPKYRGRPTNWLSYFPVLHSEILRRRCVLAKVADLEVCSYWRIKPDTLKKYRRAHGAEAKDEVDGALKLGKLDELLSHTMRQKNEGDEI